MKQSVTHGGDPYHKITMFNYVFSFPNQVHLQMASIAPEQSPCIQSTKIQSFDFQSITKDVFLATDQELAIFDVDKN